jgi:hypothetical protein
VLARDLFQIGTEPSARWWTVGDSLSIRPHLFGVASLSATVFLFSWCAFENWCVFKTSVNVSIAYQQLITNIIKRKEFQNLNLAEKGARLVKE